MGTYICNNRKLANYFIKLGATLISIEKNKKFIFKKDENLIKALNSLNVDINKFMFES